MWDKSLSLICPLTWTIIGGEDSHLWQSHAERLLFSGLVLYVSIWQGDRVSFVITLSGSDCVMEFYLSVLQHFFFFFFDKFQSFNIQRLLSRRVADLLLGGRNWLGKHSSDIWNLVHSCLIWTVWCERDSCTFEDKWSSVDSFLDYLLVHYLIGLGFWVSLLLKQLLFLIQLLLPI